MTANAEQAASEAVPVWVWPVAAFAVMFLINAVPHALAGFLALPLPTPFSGGPGTLSPPMVNSLWGLSNIAIGWLLARLAWPWRHNRALFWVLVVLGFAFAIGLSWGINMMPMPARFA